MTSQKLVRGGKEREIRNAHRLIRCGVLQWGELAFLQGLPLVIVLAAVALIIEKTQFLARADAKRPVRVKTRRRDVAIVLRLEPKEVESERRKCKGCKCNDLKFRKGKFRRIRSLDFGRVRVYVEVEVRRIRCRLRTQKPHIECVCMDMSNAYGKWVRENLPGVPVIDDHFHVIKAMNDRINGIRRKAMARISARPMS